MNYTAVSANFLQPLTFGCVQTKLHPIILSDQTPSMITSRPAICTTLTNDVLIIPLIRWFQYNSSLCDSLQILADTETAHKHVSTLKEFLSGFTELNSGK